MIDRWTFGIITGGGETERINKMIDTIERQNIPDDKYEIIIVGGNSIPRKNVVHVPFDETQKKAWITKKKNIVCQRAKFDNVVLTHDYMIFHDGWYDGWLKYGDDNWDVAMNVILNGDGTRFRDWNTQNPLFLVPYHMRAFSKGMYVSGTYWCAKKQFMLSYPLDERKSWNEWEDVEWSFRVRDFWNYKCNPNSAVQSMKQKISWINPDATVGEVIHYALMDELVAKNSEYRLVQLDSRVAPSNNHNLSSIHYVEFDMLRKFLRDKKPKQGLVMATGEGMSTVACSWAMSEYGGKLDTVDSYMLQFCNTMEDIMRNYNEKHTYPDSYCHNLVKFMIRHFGWQDTTSIHVCPIPDGLEATANGKKYDFVFLDALAMDHFRLLDLEEIKNLLQEKFIIMLNMRGANISEELQAWARSNFGLEWKNEFSSIHTLTKQ